MGTTFTETGAITQYVDVAQLVLYIFWGFFAGLVYYLVRENHREGYPLDAGRDPGPKQDGWPPVPEPKRFEMHDGQVFLSPDVNRPDGDYSAVPAHRFNGAPLEPVGDPLLAGVGPGAWAARADVPDMTHHGEVKIVPLRVASDHGVSSRDTDPRGLPFFDAAGEQAGTVVDMWVDRAEMLFRYIELQPNGSSQPVLLPINFGVIRADGVHVHALDAHQFANVPKTRSPEKVTFLEEEKIMAYYGAGLLYADPDRQEPLV